MFAFFGKETVRAPPGLHSLASLVQSDLLEDQRETDLHEKAVDLGDGNGMCFVRSPRCHHWKRAGTSCLYSGDTLLPEPEEAGQMSLESDTEPGSLPAQRLAALLHFFPDAKAPAYELKMQQALAFVGKLSGPFAFVVYDAATRRILAARDRDGSEELYWGVASDGRLLFSSRMSDLAGCNPTATAFPAGSVFVSATSRASQPGQRGWIIDSRLNPGALHSFVPKVTAQLPPKAGGQPASFRSVKAIPRITSQGCLCGSVYRVASDHNLSNYVAGH